MIVASHNTPKKSNIPYIWRRPNIRKPLSNPEFRGPVGHDVRWTSGKNSVNQHENRIPAVRITCFAAAGWINVWWWCRRRHTKFEARPNFWFWFWPGFIVCRRCKHLAFSNEMKLVHAVTLNDLKGLYNYQQSLCSFALMLMLML